MSQQRKEEPEQNIYKNYESIIKEETTKIQKQK